MTHNTFRSLVVLGLVSSLSACGQHNSPRANCFNFREAPARAASTTVSTMGEMVTRRDTECDFVMLERSAFMQNRKSPQDRAISDDLVLVKTHPARSAGG
jgi:hypothetical protein